MDKIAPGDVYAVILAAGIPKTDIDNHFSDLHLRATPAVKEIINRLECTSLLSTFRKGADGIKTWYCLPFCYMPYWEQQKAGRVR